LPRRFRKITYADWTPHVQTGILEEYKFRGHKNSGKGIP